MGLPTLSAERAQWYAAAGACILAGSAATGLRMMLLTLVLSNIESPPFVIEVAGAPTG